MPQDPIILTSREGAWLALTINRPDKLNALNRETLAELERIIDAAATDPGIRVVSITGAGNKAFVAGADITELRNHLDATARDLAQRGHLVMAKIQELGKPVIAAINGFALGGGFELTLACHLRIAADTAMLGLPEITLGLIPGYGGTQRLARLVGPGQALEMLLTGKPVNATRALELGIVNRVVAPAELAAAVEQLASQLAAAAPLAVRGILDAVNRGADRNLADGLTVEMEEFTRVCSSADAGEGTAAFLEKRKPRFSGR